jgi:hypothetical protein
VQLETKKRGPGRPRTLMEPSRWFTSEITLGQLVGLEAALHNEEPSLPPGVLRELAIAALGYPVLADLKKNAARKGGSRGRRPAIQDAKLLAQFAEILARAKGTNAQRLLQQSNGFWDDVTANGGRPPIVERLARRALSEMGLPHSHSLRQQAKAAKRHLT